METDTTRDLFRNKYRISSARLRTWDYASEGMYFVTICTKDRENYFEEIVESPIVNGRLDLLETRCIASLRATEIGKIAELEWIKTLELRPDMNIEIGEFIVMPNHFHGIIIFGDNQFNGINGDTNANKFGPQSKNLASILRGYKAAVTTNARKYNIPFAWQPRFHDHIIRSDDEFKRISNYIVDNPANWQRDKFYTS